MKAKFSEEIKEISSQDAELLRKDKLVKSKQNETGLYLLIEGVHSYTAFDYGERQVWLEEFGSPCNVKGWEKHFQSPLRALDWLYETKR